MGGERIGAVSSGGGLTMSNVTGALMQIGLGSSEKPYTSVESLRALLLVTFGVSLFDDDAAELSDEAELLPRRILSFLGSTSLGGRLGTDGETEDACVETGF